MNYEIAKQMKDAGFPIKGGGSGFYDRTPKNNLIGYAPTLSELIEACGSYFALLGQNDDCTEWKAIGGLKQLVNKEGIGSTPEEAVARLWLEIHNNLLGNEAGK